MLSLMLSLMLLMGGTKDAAVSDYKVLFIPRFKVGRLENNSSGFYENIKGMCNAGTPHFHLAL